MEIVGHKKILDALSVLAKNKELNHGYVFFGSSGVGKLSSAKALANLLETGKLEVSEGILQDAKIISPDEKGTISIDSIREIRNFVYQKPNISTKRTVIIDEAENMAEAAQNALLKIAEEPPESSLLILIVRDPELLSPTLQSRFQKIYFSEVNEDEIAELFNKQYEMAMASAKKFAAASGGKPGLAVKMFSDEGFREKVELAKKYLMSSPASRTEIVKKCQEDEFWDIPEFLDGLALNLGLCFKHDEPFGKVYSELMEIRRNFDYYNLSPRIQLENFSNILDKWKLTLKN